MNITFTATYNRCREETEMFDNEPSTSSVCSNLNSFFYNMFKNYLETDKIGVTVFYNCFYYSYVVIIKIEDADDINIMSLRRATSIESISIRDYGVFNLVNKDIMYTERNALVTE